MTENIRAPISFDLYMTPFNFQLIGTVGIILEAISRDRHINIIPN